MTTKERIDWLAENNPGLYERLENWRCVEDGDITEWLDQHGVPRELSA